MSININKISINNFKNLCRTCSQKGDLVSIEENIYLIEMLSTSANIQIQLNDELPNHICLECINELNQTFTFISKCKTSDATFRQCLTQQKLLNMKTNHKNNKTTEVLVKSEFNDDKRPDIKFVDCNMSLFENETQPKTNETLVSCLECRKCFKTNDELNTHLNDCEFKNYLVEEPMEQEENSDDEFQDGPVPEKTSVSESEEDADNSTLYNLPEKSKIQYECIYQTFKDWYQKKGIQEVSEEVLLTYFEEKSEKVQVSTLWSTYSMLKATLHIKENLDIREFKKIVPYLKKKSIGHRKKKSKFLTKEQIDQFITEADNQNYLMMKLVLIMGISGSCRRDELTNLTIDDIQDAGTVLVVKVPDSKMNIQRTFAVTNAEYVKLYREYVALRPRQLSNRRFFLKYHNGKCANQVVGINKIGAIPKLIAQFLKLPNAENFTGHCFRRTSATLFANAGIDISSFKRHSRIKS